MLRVRSLRVLVALLLCAAPVQGAEVRVIDGDTLRIGAETIRLYGIDAPEAGQPCTRNGRPWDCGGWATAQLTEILRGQSLSCRGIARDRHDRLVAVCTAGGRDINAEMVRRGAALAYRDYSTAYVEAEKEALFAQAGVWAGEVEVPATYRAAVRAAAAAANERTAPPGCQIKGNISANGRIYHRPGQEHYGDTRIDPARGERWFCSEAEARAAGWRPARR